MGIFDDIKGAADANEARWRLESTRLETSSTARPVASTPGRLTRLRSS